MDEGRSDAAGFGHGLAGHDPREPFIDLDRTSTVGRPQAGVVVANCGGMVGTYY